MADVLVLLLGWGHPQSWGWAELTDVLCAAAVGVPEGDLEGSEASLLTLWFAWLLTSVIPFQHAYCALPGCPALFINFSPGL